MTASDSWNYADKEDNKNNKVQKVNIDKAGLTPRGKSHLLTLTF